MATERISTPLPGEDEHWPTDLSFDVIIWWTAEVFMKGRAISHQADVSRDDESGHYIRAFEEGVTIPARLVDGINAPHAVEKQGVRYKVLRMESLPDDTFPRFAAYTLHLRRDNSGTA